MSDIWDWFSEKEWEYEEEGDCERLEMAQIHSEAFGLGETDPFAALKMFREGKEKAKRLQEPWWTFLYEVWISICYEEYIGNLHEGLAQALHCVNESRKPVLQNHPWRMAAYNTLLSCYIRIDPIGYDEAIRQCLRELSREIPRGPGEHRYIMMQQKREFLIVNGRYKQAEQNAFRHLALFDEDPEQDVWYVISVYRDMCYLAWRKEDWETLASFADQFEKTSRGRENRKTDLVEALIWKAILARRKGEEPEAKRLYRNAVRRSKSLHQNFDMEHYDAWSYFHQLGEDLKQAVKIREEQMAAIQGKGRYGYECDTRIKKCELLAKLGQLTAEELNRAREATHPLKKPERYLKRIQKLEKLI